MGPVHPHTRGKYAPIYPAKPAGSGHPHTQGKYCGSVHSPDDSSVHPHTRGKYSRYFITKAPGPSPHAGGNTRRQTGRPGLPAVHPHTRGKYFMFIRVLISSSGPSPHAGEIPSRTRWSAEPDRFIPTRRGNTRIHQLIIQNGSSPHAGEIQVDSGEIEPGGPSPHAGEIRQYNDVKQVLKRFIPTRRGKYKPATVKSYEWCGSSPHTGEILTDSTG